MPETTENLSVRVSQETRKQLDELAATLDRSRNWVINAAIEQYLDVQNWQVELIRARLAEAESGQAAFVSHDEVFKRQRERLKVKLGL
jgi:predicted transcriptional regulator